MYDLKMSISITSVSVSSLKFYETFFYGTLIVVFIYHRLVAPCKNSLSEKLFDSISTLRLLPASDF